VVKAARHLMNLNAAAIRVGVLPARLLVIAERYPAELPSELIDGRRWFNPGDIERIAELRAATLQSVLEGPEPSYILTCVNCGIRLDPTQPRSLCACDVEAQ
jgi:hypothetical protein